LWLNTTILGDGALYDKEHVENILKSIIINEKLSREFIEKTQPMIEVMKHA
jgi:hypothetical protein